MALHFEPDQNRYVGERLAVTVARFSDAIDELISNGMPREDVVPVLLQEEGWSTEMDGVEALDPKEWAPTLWYDLESHSYVGPRISVAFDVFRKRLRELAAGGADTAEVLNDIRKESRWSLTMAGVRPSFTAADVIAATERLVGFGAP